MCQRSGAQSRADAVPRAQCGEGQDRRPVARPDPQHDLLLASDRSIIHHLVPEWRSGGAPLRPASAATIGVHRISPRRPIGPPENLPASGKHPKMPIPNTRTTAPRSPPNPHPLRTDIIRSPQVDSFSTSQLGESFGNFFSVIAAYSATPYGIASSLKSYR